MTPFWRNSNGRGFPQLVRAIILAIVIFAALAGFWLWRTSPTKPVSFTFGSESPGDKNDRLALMNIVNSLSQSENTLPANASLADRLKKRSADIGVALDRLQTTQFTTPAIEKARKDLVTVLLKWQSYLKDKKDTKELRSDLTNLGREYPWLDALVWIIALNRL